ncbi:hypothetical protein [Paenibacillus polysaccharolyticus]|uniref:hypothetical protein n=1 Tax=Paenibacillus polysaccharolyticus TaxID=582692 RepID=UPI00280BCA82|nr:hypothetical protein [Paenibacillus polysaccharolyticus]
MKTNENDRKNPIMLSGLELFSRFERIRSYLPKNRFVRIRCSAYNFEANMQKSACLGSNKGTNRTERANKDNEWTSRVGIL